METLSALLDLFAGNSPVTGEFPAQRPVTQRLDVSSGLRLNKRLMKQSWAGDMRSHCAHYDVIVMMTMVSRLATAAVGGERCLKCSKAVRSKQRSIPRNDSFIIGIYPAVNVRSHVLVYLPHKRIPKCQCHVYAAQWWIFRWSACSCGQYVIQLNRGQSFLVDGIWPNG